MRAVEEETPIPATQLGSYGKPPHACVMVVVAAPEAMVKSFFV
jgi:hypothetical protein